MCLLHIYEYFQLLHRVSHTPNFMALSFYFDLILQKPWHCL